MVRPMLYAALLRYDRPLTRNEPMAISDQARRSRALLLADEVGCAVAEIGCEGGGFQAAADEGGQLFAAGDADGGVGV